ncbi:hypothetical protein HYPSUDRAFT_72736 [Hypholoma sublateritium FD-334 SS-4]|uniref:MYND-type domain-containing protein n=1 Tax=Hypholoma sublateritium (strain FD-334 SS-4) TaxID=945553 RepID=A0A0D2KHW2_HYPSF|nr:hypothetical protein HYPSUDRAFT_72736 [Hypholoma sublateritium FD-334 SS-4]
MDIDTKRVYKSASTKVASGRNTLSQCTYANCLNQEKVGGERFPVCASCKHSRYCTRAHQVADWARHKKECNEYQERDGRIGIKASSNELTETQIISNLLEDFIQLHDSTFMKIFNYAYHSRMVGSGIDLTRIHARVNLRYHPDCHRNPARAFHFRNLEVTELRMHDITPEALKYRDDFKANRQNDPTFINCIRCVYSVDNPAIQQHEWCPIYMETMPERIEYDWYRMLLRCLENGIVLRKIKARRGKKLVWASGIMIQSGSKWVWHERTVPQICSAGVKVPPVAMWARHKKGGVIYLPGENVPWVAPADYSWDD